MVRALPAALRWRAGGGHGCRTASMPRASPDIWFASAAHGDLGAGTGPCLFSLAGAQIKVLIKESSETLSARRPGVSVRGGFFRNMNLSWSSTLSQMKGVFRGEGTLVQSLKRHRHVARGLYSCSLCAWSNNHSPQEPQCLPPPSSCCQQLPMPDDAPSPETLWFPHHSSFTPRLS